ncbi:MAG: FlgD immunoglobulin-like domain containing protein [bacterium]
MSSCYIKAVLFSLFGVLFVFSLSWAQTSQTAGSRYAYPWPDILKSLDASGCIQDIPAPILMSEPRYTQGKSNIIGFRLPPLEDISFPPDTIRGPFVVTLVHDGSDNPPLEFPRPVVLNHDSTQFEFLESLKNGTKYLYTTALFLPICKIGCEAVDDTSQLELHCSAYQDTVWSIQDSEAPLVENVTIPQLDSTSISGWWNRSTIQIEADISDPAGVWQGFLYQRTCSSNDWGAAIADTTFEGDLTGSGFVFADLVKVSFTQTLADGCYEFRVEGKDATHSPESWFPDFQLAGNERQPTSTDDSQVTIQIDTTPPDTITLTCNQVLNSIELQWSSSIDPAPGIGLEGYLIFRDGVLLTTVDASNTSYVDSFTEDTPDTLFEYQVQPFDSLNNVQTEGGFDSCRYRGVPTITMTPEPEFTPGFSNTVCWINSQNFVYYQVFLDEDCDFVPEDSVRIDDPSVTCHTFNNLTEGKQYCYWVRAEDEHQRVVSSDTVMSIQDATAPEISSLELRDKTIIDGRDWTNKREIQLRLIAADAPPGEIQKFQIFENSIPDSIRIFQNPAAQIESMISYLLKLEECVLIEVSVKVFDGAGNESTLSSITAYLDTTPPDPVDSLKCQQVQDSIVLNWTASADSGDCSGLAGYLIFRDGALLDTVSNTQATYEDVFGVNTPHAFFDYQVQPCDFAGNVQTQGGSARCEYEPPPRITMQPEPEFTAGLSNAVCWSSSPIIVSYKIFLDEDCDFIPEDSVEISNSSMSTICHTFDNLDDGQVYCYWVQAEDQLDRVISSDTVRSTQDDAVPILDNLRLVNADTVDGRIWTFTRALELRVVAHDSPPGEIWNYEIRENGMPESTGSFVDSAGQIDTIISYSLKSEENCSIDISVKVLDGAGHESNQKSMVICYQDLNSRPTMFAFPNPYNPMDGTLTIRLSAPNETEIKIYDFFGNLVRTLNNKEGRHDFLWDGLNGRGEMVSNGGYICIGSTTKARFKIGVIKRSF